MKQKLFNAPLTFGGRIGRLEFSITFVIYSIISYIVENLIRNYDFDEVAIPILLHIGLTISYITQRTKRFHDVGISGWWQLVPVCDIYLIFAKGEKTKNKYGLPIE